MSGSENGGANKFLHMPRIRDVRVSDVNKANTFTIGKRYPHLRSRAQNPEDDDLDNHVEDESPESQIEYVCVIEDKQINQRQCFCRHT